MSKVGDIFVLWLLSVIVSLWLTGDQPCMTPAPTNGPLHWPATWHQCINCVTKGTRCMAVCWKIVALSSWLPINKNVYGSCGMKLRSGSTTESSIMSPTDQMSLTTLFYAWLLHLSLQRLWVSSNLSHTPPRRSLLTWSLVRCTSSYSHLK